MFWGYKTESLDKHPIKLEIDFSTHCHACITGGSGSGKSYALLYLLGNLLKHNKDLVNLWFCDFKASYDFSFLNDYKQFSSGDSVYDGIMEYYQRFCNFRKKREKSTEKNLIIIDEYPALILYLSGRDKLNKTKQANEVLNAIAEILMLGRGIGYAVWIVTQRADSVYFSNGSRDNFMVCLGLGNLSKESVQMLFSGEQIPDRRFHTGEGVLLADGFPLQEVTFPKIQNIVGWKKHILEILMKNTSW